MISIIKMISAALLFLFLSADLSSLVPTSAAVLSGLSKENLAAPTAYQTADFSVAERFVLPSLLLAADKTILTHQKEKIFVSDPIETDFPFSGLILQWRDFLPPEGEALLEVSLLQSDNWTEWREVEPDNELKLPEVDSEGYFQRDSLVFAQNAKAFRYRVTLRSDNSASTPVIEDLEFQYLHTQGPVPSSRLIAGLILPFSDLQIIKRTEWGANEEFTFKKYFADTPAPIEIESVLPPTRPLPTSEAVVIKKLSHDPLTGEELLWPLEYPDRVKKIFIHHTATTKDLEDPVTALRNIYYYHTVRKRWGDIGYNYLIDPQGKIYEGRRGGDGVAGGHTNGYNRGSVGIALLGDFEQQQPTYAMLTSLIKLTRQISDTYGLDPEGVGIFNETILPNISGHHEVSATRCPGGSMTDMLPAVRRIASKIGGNDNSSFDSVTTEVGSASVPDYSFNLAQNLSPIYLEADSETELIIRVKNTGLKTWDENTFLVAAENPNNQGRLTFPDQHKISLQTEKTVSPGEIGSYKLKLKSARQAAFLSFDLTLIFNGTTKNDRYFSLPVYVNAPPKPVPSVSIETQPSASLIAAPAFLTFKPLETKTLQFQLRNTGGGDWSQEDQDSGLFQVRTLHNPAFRLSQSIRFTEDLVKNGEVASFSFSITAPALSENYSLALIPSLRGQKLLPRPLYFHFGVSDPNLVKTDSSLNLSSKTENPLRVRLSFNKDNAFIGASSDYVVRSNNTDLLRLRAGEIIELSLKNNKISVKNKNATFALPAPLRFVPTAEGILTVHNLEKRPAWNPDLNDNRFRGILEIRIDKNQLLLINELPLEQYLAGIGEVSNGDPEEKIKAIIILARTYARYYRDRDRKFPGAAYDLDDNPDVSQKYLGYGLEERSPRIAQAVSETKGLVVTYRGELVKTPYFNSSDGRTRSAREVWGWNHTPYLESVPDPLCGEKTLKGHGVGLSGCGATAAAKLGKNAREIIQYYYRGVEIEVRQ